MLKENIRSVNFEMTNKKLILKISLIIIGVGILSLASVAYYLFNMPHRNIQSGKTDFTLSVTQIVDEYLKDPLSANEKYLNEEGDSKILEIAGVVAGITKDFNNQKVILLKSANDKAGVSCTIINGSVAANEIQIGQIIRVKGVIRSGASYDDDFGMYENIIMEECDVVK